MPQYRIRFNVHTRLGLIALSVTFFLAGCSPETGQITAEDPIEPKKTFTVDGNDNQPAPDRWWTSFNDDELDTLIQDGLQSNLTLKTSWQRLQAARAVVDRESSSLFPSLQANAQGGITKSDLEFENDQNITLGLSSSYEIDLWGRIGSNIDAAEFRAEASRTDYQTAALSLSAEITRTSYRLVEERNQLELLQQQIQTNQTVLNLLESRFGSGQIRSVDILRQRQLLESTREQKSRVESRIKTLEHQLAVLLGRQPGSNSYMLPDSLPDIPPMPDTGIPSDLVQRRPDVRSAFNRLKAADRDLASAISNQYPRLSLSASVSSAAENATGLFQDWALSFAGNIIAPILRGGELSAEVDRVDAVKQQRLYEYGQTVLTSFQEVENALVREQKQKESIHSLERQLKLARQSYEQLRLEYFNGISDYLDVLTALDEVQRLQRDLLTERLILVEYRIALYRALAGPINSGPDSRDMAAND